VKCEEVVAAMDFPPIDEWGPNQNQIIEIM